MNYYITTDLHLFHKNIIQYENRPGNFEELIFSNFKSQLKKDDVLINLGDVIFGKAGVLGTEFLFQLPGKHILTRGNHDYKKSQWYKDHGFSEVYKDYYILGEICFSHIPQDIIKISEETDEKILYNIHGHFHSQKFVARGEDSFGPSRDSEDYPFYNEKTHIRLSVEEENYKLITVEDFILKHNLPVPNFFKTEFSEEEITEILNSIIKKKEYYFGINSDAAFFYRIGFINTFKSKFKNKKDYEFYLDGFKDAVDWFAIPENEAELLSADEIYKFIEMGKDDAIEFLYK